MIITSTANLNLAGFNEVYYIHQTVAVYIRFYKHRFDMELVNWCVFVVTSIKLVSLHQRKAHIIIYNNMVESTLPWEAIVNYMSVFNLSIPQAYKWIFSLSESCRSNLV